MKLFTPSLSLVLAAAAFVAACGVPPATGAGVTPTASPIVSQGSGVTDYASLLDELRKAGATVEPNGEIEQAFFSVKAQIIQINGNDVQVFEYAAEADAQAEADLVAPDGGSVGTSMVMWVATPHFYKSGKVIALYVGDDAATLELLKQALGLQFAGGPFVSQGESTGGEVTLGGGMPLPAADAAVKALAPYAVSPLSKLPSSAPKRCNGPMPASG